jgi:hypothetical protein
MVFHGNIAPIFTQPNHPGTGAKMPVSIKKDQAEDSLRNILQASGYDLSPEGHFGNGGVDVIASRGDDIFYIDVIGYKVNGPKHARDFYEAFFRAVSRLKEGAKKCVIALPYGAKCRLPARAMHQGDAWTRIGEVFPELEIWLIDEAYGRIERSGWNEWRKTAN